MRFPLKALLLASALAVAGAAHAEGRRIGFAAPLDGPLALLGAQMRDGATLAAREAGAELIVADDQCSAEGGEAAARDLVGRRVEIAVGFLCTDAIEAALPILAEAGIPVVTPGVRSNGLTDRRERTGWPVWRLGPRADSEIDAVSSMLTRLWRDQLFAIVDDGTIHGRELAESLRLAAELAGLQPVFVDTYRPQSDNQIGLVGRLRRAGATHVFVGGDRDDVAIIARDAAGLDHELTIAGGEALRATGEIPLAAGTLMVGLPEWAEAIDEGEIGRFHQAEIVPEGYVVPAFAAVEVAVQALDRAEAESVAAGDILGRETFQTLLGPVAFDGKGDLTESLFRLLVYDGERFLPAEE